MDINLPLRRDANVRVGSNGNVVWIDFWYEKMLDFCFAYGRLSHISRECLLEEPRHMIPDSKFPIRNWLKGLSFAKPFDHCGRWEGAHGFGRPSPLKADFDEPGPVQKDATLIQSKFITELLSPQITGVVVAVGESRPGKVVSNKVNLISNSNLNIAMVAKGNNKMGNSSDGLSEPIKGDEGPKNSGLSLFLGPNSGHVSFLSSSNNEAYLSHPTSNQDCKQGPNRPSGFIKSNDNTDGLGDIATNTAFVFDSEEYDDGGTKQRKQWKMLARNKGKQQNTARGYVKPVNASKRRATVGDEVELLLKHRKYYER
ncbi:Zinc knuckle CX2CX4HX4C [Trema orientale]|uniref:Zinc knuckle CX2CX4HX4C n=1 Tax=Trema orientale TaxID=63057 RepID=A0A2P5F3C5_TREOI|nr:Zinc knuckle CX2CX4HX4C [Trema orientale]